MLLRRFIRRSRDHLCQAVPLAAVSFAFVVTVACGGATTTTEPDDATGGKSPVGSGGAGTGGVGTGGAGTGGAGSGGVGTGGASTGGQGSGGEGRYRVPAQHRAE